MDFALTEEQQLIVKTTRHFVENELYPHEKEVEDTGFLRPELINELKRKAMEAGLYAANMPSEVGGGGLDTLTWVLYEKELGKANYALHYNCVVRPSNILMACQGEQRDRYLLPSGARRTHGLPGDERAGRGFGPARHENHRSPRRQGLRHQRHQALHQSCRPRGLCHPDRGDQRRGVCHARSAQEDDRVPGRHGPSRLRSACPATATSPIAGTTTAFCRFNDCRVGPEAVLGEVDKGFEVANTWLGATRLQVAACCLGRAERALDLAKQWAVDRVQFGQSIGKFQGISFKLADMAVELRAAELLVLEAAWKNDQGTATDSDFAIAKLKATEMLAMVADEALQIHGGMGLMADLPLERIWRDARIDRIWDGTSEIQRHIISRALLRPLGG